MKTEGGIHIFGKVFLPAKLTEQLPSWYIDHIWSIVKKAGLTPIGEPGCFEFEGGGFTAFIILAESHVSLHTWPELGFLDMDVFVCNVTRDNSQKARQIFTEVTCLFEATKVIKQEVPR